MLRWQHFHLQVLNRGLQGSARQGGHEGGEGPVRSEGPREPRRVVDAQGLHSHRGATAGLGEGGQGSTRAGGREAVSGHVHGQLAAVHGLH